MRLNVPEQPGAVTIRALRATSWTEEPALSTAVANATIGGPVQRLLLRGDVHISLGVYDFSAARAVVWLEYLGPSTASPGTDLYQVAIYFDRVGEPTAGAGTVQSGDRLLVTGIVAGRVSLDAASLRQGRPALASVGPASGGAAPGDELLLVEGEQRLARLLNDLARPAGSPPGPDSSLPPPRVPGSAVITPAPGLGPMVPGVSRPFEPGSLLGREAVYGPLVTTESAVATTSPAQRVSPTRTDPLFSPSGLVTFAAGEPTLVAGGDENAVIITGGVVVQYTDAARARTLQISAQRAVAFLDGGPIADILRSPSDRVRGVYLEGDAVATDGTYTLRGQSIYYDFRANRAIVLDAVFSTYDQRRAMPLYVRAKTLMQTAANQVTGEGVRLANSSFFTPHLSIGASSITVTRQQPVVDDDGNTTGVATTYLQGSDITLRAGNTPFFYFPEFEGDVLNFPLRDIRVENSSRSGAAIKTSFDAFGLLSITPPEGFRADLLVDGYTKRGVGLGTVGSNDTADARGEWLAYLVPDDRGTDQLTTGVERQQTGRTRGILLGEQRIDLSDRWSVFLEGAYISDVNFVDAYYEPLAETRREFANAAYLRFRGNNSAFGLVAKGSLNAFTPNEYLLQSLGYTVDRLPEATYSRVADDLLPGLAPGMVQWTSEYRAGRLSLSLENRTPRDIGLINNFTSQRAFGLNAADNIAQALRARGLTSADVFRADTRQELAGTFTLGPVTVNPFVV
ncbi:MAG: hypothetical protein K2X91_04765, partial [Thermoleophilia bacterium]|nr:hypothetical protein [Thermoleophilia bacterium]